MIHSESKPTEAAPGDRESTWRKTETNVAGNSYKSQTDQLLDALQEGRRITALIALRQFGCGRLAARIWDLRKAGHDVQTKTIRQRSRSHAVYWLPKEK